MPVNEDLADATIAHRLDLLRFEAGIAARVVAAYRGALDDVVLDLERARAGYLAGDITLATVEALEARAAGLRLALSEVYAEARGLMSEGLDATARVEIEALIRAWARSVPDGIDVSFTRPLLGDVLVALNDPIGGRVWHERLAADLLAVHDGLQDHIARALAAGRSMDRAAREIGDALGIVETTRGRLVGLVRTEVQRVANTAALATYEANADVIGEVEYLATLDSRTCPICAPLHGQVWPLGSPEVRVPPLHPRCRCFLSPVSKSWAELGLAPAQANLFDGRPSGGPDFADWLRRQPDATADEVLGPTRADAWREGVALDRFSDDRGVIPLDEMRRRFPEAFDA